MSPFRLSILLFAAAALSWPQSLEDAMHNAIAGVTAGLPPRSPVALSIENRSGVPAADVEHVRQVAEKELGAAGFSTGDSDQKLRLVLSEDVQGPLLIIQLGARTAMSNWEVPRAATEGKRLTIVTTPVLQQHEPMLDMLFSADGNTLVVLEAARIAQYSNSGGQWTLARAVSLPLIQPLPRDPRGRLTGSVDNFQVDAPGNSCTGSIQPALKIACEAPTGSSWVPDRDYFNDAAYGLLYTKAEVPGVVIIAGVNGVVHAAGKDGVVYANWGSDLAAVRSKCGSGTQVIATRAGADEDEDQLTAYEIGADDGATAVSDPLPVAGTVTALWTAATGATLVMRNVRSGNYEASRLAIACSQ